MSNRVRQSVQQTVSNDSLRHVKIDDKKIAALGEQLQAEEFTLPSWRAPVMLDERQYSPERVFDYFLVGNTLNFVFDDLTTNSTFSTTYNGTRWSGAFAMWASLKRAVEAGIDITSGPVLRNLSLDQTAEIFYGDPPIPLLETRHAVLSHIGERLCATGDEYFHNAVTADGEIRMYNEGDGIVEWLAGNFPEAYADKRIYRGETVYFDKKSQLSMGMVHGRFQDHPRYTVADIDDITIFADYLIPALFRERGVFDYSEELTRAVDAQDPILEGSPQEVEIRIATIIAGERLLKMINAEHDEPVTGFHLDQALWRTGRNQELVHHLTETRTY